MESHIYINNTYTRTIQTYIYTPIHILFIHTLFIQDLFIIPFYIFNILKSYYYKNPILYVLLFIILIFLLLESTKL